MERQCICLTGRVAYCTRHWEVCVDVMGFIGVVNWNCGSETILIRKKWLIFAKESRYVVLNVGEIDRYH